MRKIFLPLNSLITNQMTNSSSNNQPSWFEYIPWFSTISSSIVLAVIAIFLINQLNWFKEQSLPTLEKVQTETKSTEPSDNQKEVDTYYLTYVLHMHLSFVKQSIGLFSGFALMFLGLSITLYTIGSQNSLQIEGPGVSAQLISASPGLISVLIGAFLVFTTITTQTSFPPYSTSTQPDQTEHSTEFPNAPGR
jgi:hypothetical protein